MHLGELEKKVMDVIWAFHDDTFTVRDIADRVDGDYAYNTILTVMTHLYEKKLLKRRKKGRSCEYSVQVDRSAFVKRSSKALFDRMRNEFGHLAIAHFADLVDDIDPAVLREAKKSLNQK